MHNYCVKTVSTDWKKLGTNRRLPTLSTEIRKYLTRQVFFSRELVETSIGGFEVFAQVPNSPLSPTSSWFSPLSTGPINKTKYIRI